MCLKSEFMLSDASMSALMNEIQLMIPFCHSSCAWFHSFIMTNTAGTQRLKATDECISHVLLYFVVCRCVSVCGCVHATSLTSGRCHLHLMFGHKMHVRLKTSRLSGKWRKQEKQKMGEKNAQILSGKYTFVMQPKDHLFCAPTASLLSEIFHCRFSGAEQPIGFGVTCNLRMQTGTIASFAEKETTRNEWERMWYLDDKSCDICLNWIWVSFCGIRNGQLKVR